MLVKKPYAFLIKNFKVIHGLLFGMLLYLILKLFSIYSFFNEYSSNGYYFSSGNLENDYLNIFMFIAISIIIIVNLIIFYLLSIKRKENKIYLISLLYNIGIFIYLFFMFTVFQKLNVSHLNAETVRLYEDISLIALIPELIFAFIALGRTLGFNLRKFDFKKDLDDIIIEDEDNEEVELTLGNDTYKINRFFRKLIRLCKYFFLEHRLFIIITSSSVVLFSCILFFLNINVYSVNYSENTEIVANTLWYKVNKSYLSSTNINNKIIYKDKIYLLIDLDIENKLNSIYTLSRETFRLDFDGELLFPVFTFENSFYDFGEIFAPKNLKEKEKKRIVVVFELNNEKIQSSFTFKIKNYGSNSIIDMKSQYKDIILYPVMIDEIKDKGIYKVNETISFNDTILNNSSLNISEYSIADKYNDIYNYCQNEKCRKIKYTVAPNNIGRGEFTILKFNSNFILDDNLYLKNFVKTSSDFLEKYAYLEYDYLGKRYRSYLEKISINYNEDIYSYLQTSKNIKLADKIDLIILIRGIKYTINLK